MNIVCKNHLLSEKTVKMETNNNTTTKIEIVIPYGTKLTYYKPKEVGGGIGILSVNRPLYLSLSACIVLIGRNKYVAVTKWYAEKETLKDNLVFMEEYTLPERTPIIMENGIAVFTVKPMEVELPKTFDVKLRAGTKLQQVDNLSVRLVLNTDCNATIVFDEYDFDIICSKKLDKEDVDWCSRTKQRIQFSSISK